MLIEVFQQLNAVILEIQSYRIDAFKAESSRVILDGLHWAFASGFWAMLIFMVLLANFYLFMAIAVAFRRKKPSPGLVRGQEPFVTVQIPTYNELAALNCARRCIDFDWPEDKMLIVIGDDSDDSSVSEKIDAFAARHPQILVTRRGGNAGYKAGNLNHMLKRTRGDYIVIFDSDFLPERDFLRKIMYPLIRDPNVSGVQGRWKIGNFGQNTVSLLGGTISLMCHHIALEFINLLEGNAFLCGAAEAIRRKDLEAVGGWRVGSLTEDIEFSLRLIYKGKRIVYLQDVECECEAPHRFRDLCRQQMRWAYGAANSIRMHARSVLLTRKTSLRNKASIAIFVSGYLFSFLLLCVISLAILRVVTEPPAPIDWDRVIRETSVSFLLTSGFFISSAIALARVRGIGDLPRMLLTSLSVGLGVTYYVNIGLFKACFGRQMKWFMIQKNGNEKKACV